CSRSTGRRPAGIVVRPAGTYVVNQGAAKIQQFTSLGSPITEWGTYGSGDGEFRFPYGIAANSDGNLYVTDRDNYRVQKFSSTGSYHDAWGAPGTSGAPVRSPRGTGPRPA